MSEDHVARSPAGAGSGRRAAAGRPTSPPPARSQAPIRPQPGRPADPIRVALDAPEVVRAGLVALLADHRRDVRVHPPTQAHDVVVVDRAHSRGTLSGPGGGVAVVVLLSPGDHTGTAMAEQSGAVAIPITSRADQVVTAIQGAHAAARPSPSTSTWAQAPRRATADLAPDLSRREEDVVDGVCRGLSNDQIAAELFVSANTIKSYIRSAYRKMGVEHRRQALVWGLHRGYGREPRQHLRVVEGGRATPVGPTGGSS